MYTFDEIHLTFVTAEFFINSLTEIELRVQMINIDLQNNTPMSPRYCKTYRQLHSYRINITPFQKDCYSVCPVGRRDRQKQTMSNYSDVFLFLMTLISLTQGLEIKRIHTQLGDIVGVVEHVRNEKVYQFRNVPYAEPPIGALRFTKPQAIRSWPGTLDATRFGPSCMQPVIPHVYNKFLPNLNLSEDCLLLNIYVPRDMSPSSNRSVMVWIHGGTYISGQGMFYDGSYLALSGDVVVVTINYRLGVFGFLSTSSTGRLQGNYGLWDQHMALQWVKDNIAAFGGNPNSVTIFGQSAGGFSVSLQAIIPQNQGLFQRLIAQSGNAVSHFAYSSLSNKHNVATFLGMNVGCANASGIPVTYKVCMRGKSARDLLAAQNAVSIFNLHPLQLDIPFGPVVDNDLLQSSPDILLKDKKSASYQFFRSLDFMTGNVNAEGSLFLDSLKSISNFKKFNISDGIPSDVFCEYIVPAIVNAFFGSQVNSTLPSDIICSLYGTTEGGQEGDNAIDVYSDAFFISPAIKSLMAHSESNAQTPSYQYIFNRPKIGPHFQAYPPRWQNDSSPHASEIAFLFGLEDYPTKYNISVSPTDVRLSKIMLKYWTNFAKTGNPNSNDVPVWGAYDTVQQSYIDLNTTITSGQHLYGEWINLWIERLPKLFDTSNPGGAIRK